MLGHMNTRKSTTPLVFTAFVIALSWSEVVFGEPTPCTLLAQDQVSAVLGVSVGAGSPIANTGCSWKATGASKAVVTVSLQSEKMFAGAKSSSAPNMTKTSVSGVGDEAIFTGIQGFSSLWIRKGTTFLLVRVYGLPVSEAQTKLKDLAVKAVSKL